MANNNKKSKVKKDKIFNNSYNTGDVEFEFFGKLRIKDGYQNNQSYTDWERMQLDEELYNIFVNAPFYERFLKTKRVPKSEMLEIYYYFFNRLPKEKYTAVQKFTAIADFMDFNYKEMFYMLGPVDKQNIIIELDTDYKILKRAGLKRLF